MPIFPKVDNQRSMLYVGNLCWFVRQVVDKERQGLFFPQNSEYMNTSEMVKEIAKFHEKRVLLFFGFSWIDKISVEIFQKVFGNLKLDTRDVISAFTFSESLNPSSRHKIVPT